MLSIVICTLNEELYLPKLLDTLMLQEGVKFEVLIIDAKSDDDTSGVAAAYAAKAGFPVTFHQLPRPGLSAQRNFAVLQAKYEWLLFLDADVLLPADFLRNSMEEIASRKIAIAGTRIYSAEKALLFRFGYWAYSAFYLPVVRLWNPILHGCSIFVTRELHRQTGGFREGVTFEDFRYAADAAKIAPTKLLKSTYVRTSARRFYKFKPAEIAELMMSGIHSIFKAGIDNPARMKRFHENYGKHGRPRY